MSIFDNDNDEIEGIERYFSYPNRLYCSALEELRVSLKNISKMDPIFKRSVIYMMSLVEEIQTLGNRMEAGLEDLKDQRGLAKEVRLLKERRNKLRKEVLDLQIDKSTLEDEVKILNEDERAGFVDELRDLHEDI